MQRSKRFLEQVTKELVEFTEDVSVESSTDEMGVLLILHVAKEDMGKVIGRNGDTAKAIRHLLRIVGMREMARINLKIAEPQQSYGDNRASYNRDSSIS